MMSARRLFFALWAEEPFIEQLSQAAAPLLQVARGQSLRSQDLHVTLCFLGAVAEARLEALRVRAAQIRSLAFELEFRRLEFLAKPRVIAAVSEQAPAAGTALADALAAAAAEVGLTPDHKPWRPHVTLMRGAGRPTPADGSAAPWPLLQLRLPATRFYLAESQRVGAHTAGASPPARYARLASWPLLGR